MKQQQVGGDGLRVMEFARICLSIPYPGKHILIDFIRVNLRTISAYLRQERHTRPGVSLPASEQFATTFLPSPSRTQAPASSPHHPAATLPSGRRSSVQNLLL